MTAEETFDKAVKVVIDLPWDAWVALGTLALALVTLMAVFAPLRAARQEKIARAEALSVALFPEVYDALVEMRGIQRALKKIGTEFLTTNVARECLLRVQSTDFPILNTCVTDLGCFEIETAKSLGYMHSTFSRARRTISQSPLAKPPLYGEGYIKSSWVMNHIQRLDDAAAHALYRLGHETGEFGGVDWPRASEIDAIEVANRIIEPY